MSVTEQRKDSEQPKVKCQPAIKVENLSFKYNDADQLALENLNFSVEQGEFLLITGMSGCGKSTLALALAGFLREGVHGRYTGSSAVYEMDPRAYSVEQIAGVVGVVQQDPEAQMCTFTVSEEVAFAPENLCLQEQEILERVKRSMEDTGIALLAERELHSLSGGEKQRVAIASILAMKPSVLILDEPTANLDPKGTREIIDVLKNINQQSGQTIIVIEHRIEAFLPFVSRMMILERGNVCFDGSPAAGAVYYRKFCEAATRESDRQLAIHRNQTREETLLEVRDLSTTIQGKRVLSDVSFSVRRGEAVAVMGNNGSGKTTLFLTLLGIYQALSGSLFFGKEGERENLTEMPTYLRAKYMGLVMQNPNHQIFEKTVWQEMMLPYSFIGGNGGEGLASSDRRHSDVVWDILKKLSLDQYADLPPFSLSQGEKKRLTLGSVLTYGPSLLLLDEPMAGQDQHHLDVLMQMIFAHCRQGGACIVACHLPEVVLRYFDRVLFFEQGKLLFDDVPGRVFEQLYALERQEYDMSGDCV